MPFILTLFKLCKKFQIEDSMIRSLAYNDLLYIVIDFQKDEIEQYLNNMKKQGKHQETQELNDRELYNFLVGRQKGVIT